jgi:hypothetical protein
VNPCPLGPGGGADGPLLRLLGACRLRAPEEDLDRGVQVEQYIVRPQPFGDQQPPVVGCAVADDRA